MKIAKLQSPTCSADIRIRRKVRRDGIVLLIVLGMLSLFTVLVVSFVVFSSQMANSSYSSEQRRLTEILPDPPIESAVLQFVAGTQDSRSAAYGRSFLEDFYGVDGLQMRVGHRRPDTSPATVSTVVPVVPSATGPDYRVARGQLLLPLNANNEPQTTLFKFPTNFANWHFDGHTSAVTLPPGNVDPEPQALRTYLDDVLAGRVLTFDEGPLKNVSFRIVRYFGKNNGTTSRPPGTSVDLMWEYSLAGNVVVDLAEIGEEIVEIDGVPERLYLVAANYPNRLLYSPGPDDSPGRRNFDDDQNGTPDDESELGYPGTDDYGYRFVVNGQVFNGQGVNPDGQSGLVRLARPREYNPSVSGSGNPLQIDSNASIELSLNSRLIGSHYWGGNSPNGATPQFDEGWDAPDIENLFLAWQPSDHRRAFNASVYSGVNGAELNRQLGQYIIPSFHRPSIINYLMNSPILLPGESIASGTTDVDFAELARRIRSGSASANDLQRLTVLIGRLRRATMRPLNVSHDFDPNGIIGGNDLNADGDPFDGAPLFSGSNSAPILQQPIDVNVNPSNAVEIVNDIEQLCIWLVNGPWDIDNDGDGLPDSIWVDLNLPTVTAPNGQLLRPLVAPLIEDLDGKINVNYSGSYNQLITQRYTTGPIQGPTAQQPYTNLSEFFNANGALDSFGIGGGLGPAEIDFSHLFAFDRPISTTLFLGPYATNQTGSALTIDTVLQTRYGNLLNVRNGGQVYTYTRPYPYSSLGVAANFLRFPGAGTRYAPQAGSDVLARAVFPARVLDFRADARIGRPVDMSGLVKTRKDRTGTHRFTDLPNGDEIVNQPYEFGSDEIRGDDTPFTPAEHVDLISGGPLNGRLTQLLDDAANRNEALRRLITAESRSVESPDIPGQMSVLHLVAEKFGTLASPTIPLELQSVQLQRMLAVELRKGSKLNLNRQLTNGDEDTPVPAGGPGVMNFVADDTGETETQLLPQLPLTTPATYQPNTANNRRTGDLVYNFSTGTVVRNGEEAFPGITSLFPQQGYVSPYYTSSSMGPVRNTTMAGQPSRDILDFDGFDTNGDGVLDQGTLFDTNGSGAIEAGIDTRQKVADGSELLARHLYCLMFALIENRSSGGELVPNFPYPQNFSADVNVRNGYVAKRLAQWAANAVDYRDYDARCTRLRYDPNPFDSNGFSLHVAARNTVWGMERPELQLTEALATHDKRLKRNLPKEPSAADATLSVDGEKHDDDDTSDPNVASDGDMDQFRIPQASAFVEIQALAPALRGNGERQPHAPQELYNGTALDLGRVVGSVVTIGATTVDRRSPVWRMAVGERTGGDPLKSTRFIFDADRLRDLSAAPASRQDIPDYLPGGANPIDWTDPMSRDAAVDTWNEALRHSADIQPSPRRTADPARTEFLRLADDDFDLSTPSNARVELKRFVWFAPLAPTNTMSVVNDPLSGMRLDNVFFNKLNRVDPSDSTLPENASPILQPGQFAVVSPRSATHFGQKKTSTAPNYIYQPSEQQLTFRAQGVAATPQPFRLDYFGIGDPGPQAANPEPQSPYYLEDTSAPTSAPGYHVASVVPIICESLYPDEVDPGRTDWANYRGNPAASLVDMGFNISAPLPGAAYYKAPTQRIWTDPGDPALTYPLIDGYRDYNANRPLSPGTNLNHAHPDTPLDHNPSAPLAQNNFEWAAVGTHEEAATVFLQRLADPTMPWHPIDNPYVTVDFLPMDLTTFNGEHDVRENVDRNVEDPGNPGTFIPTTQLVDNRSIWTAANGFTPEVKFDSRRKIPDAEKDRAITVLIQNVNAPSQPSDYDRTTVVKRSPLSMTTSVLRPTQAIDRGNAAATDYWMFELGSMWVTGNYFNGVPNDPLDTSYGINSSTSEWLSFDIKPTLGAPPRPTDPHVPTFHQSFGFINREYGNLVRSDSVRANSFGNGPYGVYMLTIPWMDREYQSPFDLMNVPAVSRTSLLATFGPGTRLEDNYTRELPIAADPNATLVPFDHLLGFDQGFGNFRQEDMKLENNTRTRLPLGMVENADGTFASLTGERAGFERIFDFVDVGPVWFDSQRWFEPSSVQFRQDQSFSTANPSQRTLFQMFNRSVDTLQPPYNYVSKNRIPGKINLNTTPDYIRKGPEFHATAAQDNFLDGEIVGGAVHCEDPSEPSVAPQNENDLFFEPANFPVDSNGFTGTFFNASTPALSAELFGNGSVYRAFAWGGSSPYELDLFGNGSPETMGQDSRYEATVDSFFGKSFKGFIESRRGFSTTTRGTTFLGNPDLDARYPTRFAGAFAAASASRTPSVQRFMRLGNHSGEPQATPPAIGTLPLGWPANPAVGVPRRTHDMTVLRPHPDFDLRTMRPSERNAYGTATDTSFSLRVEDNASGSTPVAFRVPTVIKQEVRDLRMPMVNTKLFDRSEPELHMNLRNLDRDSYFRNMNTARVANLTTHHSNVFLMRLTVGYFVVDPATGSLGREYINDTGEAKRTRATYVIDRTVPVGFLPGKYMNTEETILFSEITE